MGMFKYLEYIADFVDEQYIDKTRGPLNEGGLFAERQGSISFTKM